MDERMQIPFVKMEGCGNDYIYLNGFEPVVAKFLSSLSEEELSRWIAGVSDRHFGIGGDGVILALPCEGFDGRMRMFNADGSEGKMCGNGIRCVAKLIYDANIAKKEVLRLMTAAGERLIKVSAENGKLVRAEVDMGVPIWETKKIPMTLDLPCFCSAAFQIGEKEYVGTAVSMGNPHLVIFGDDPDLLDLPAIGPDFEANPLFPESVNTEFVQLLSPTHIKMRVWERGSGETLACGTGASAVAAAAVRNGLSPKGEKITLSLTGGDLWITVTDDTVLMEGPATTVFTGLIETDI